MFDYYGSAEQGSETFHPGPSAGGAGRQSPTVPLSVLRGVSEGEGARRCVGRLQLHLWEGQKNGGLRVPGAHFARPSAGVALPQRGHRATLSRHRGLSVPCEGFPCTSGTETMSREHHVPGREEKAGLGGCQEHWVLGPACLRPTLPSVEARFPPQKPGPCSSSGLSPGRRCGSRGGGAVREELIGCFCCLWGRESPKEGSGGQGTRPEDKAW